MIAIQSAADRLMRAALVAGVAVSVVTCTEGTAPNPLSVDEFFAAVSAQSGTQAALRTGTPPAGGGGPTVTPASTGAAIVGGSAQIDLSAPQAFQTVIVFVDGIDDYYELTLPAAVTQTTIVVTIAQNPPERTFDAAYMVGDASGTFGIQVIEQITAISVGTGEIQVSVSWDAPADVDLHVVDPSGEEVYFGNPEVASGGELDLDSNPACNIDNVNNENVTWPDGSAPRGEYIVRVAYYADCGVQETDYIVTVQVRGRAPELFTGTFTGAGTGGGAESGVEVARFTS